MELADRVTGEAERPPFLEELRPSSTKSPDRLGVRHIELRDQALSALDRADASVKRLEALERGEAGEPIRSPRFKEVQKISTDLRNLRAQLDRTYV